MGGERAVVRLVADGDEQPVDLDFPLLAVLPHDDARQLVRAEKARDRGIQDKLDVALLPQRAHQRLLTAEAVAPVDEIDAARGLGEEHRVLQRAVAAAADGHGQILEERAVAHRAVAHAGADKLLLALHAEHPRLGAGRKDHGASLIVSAEFTADTAEIAAVLDPGDLFDLDLSALGHSLLGHTVAQVRAGDRHDRGEVLHLRAPGDLAAERGLLQDQNALARAAGIYGGRQPRGAAADHDDIIHGSLLLI